jgi:flagellar motor switch protein FliN
MDNPPVLKIDVFFEAWLASLVTLVSQLSSETWTAAGTSTADGYTPLASLRIKLAQGLKGSFWLAISAEDAAVLLETFTGDKLQTSGALDEMQTEALTELVRQWAGLAATQLKPAFGEVSVEVAVEAAVPPDLMAARLLRTAFGDRHLAVRVEMDAELLALFDRRQGPRAQLVPEPNSPAGLEQLLREGNLDLLLDVELGVTLRFGSRRASLREVLELSPGAVLELNREIQEPVDLLLNDRVIARGDVVVVDGNYGLHIAEVIAPEQRMRAL